jgi:hypothetical protein
LPQVVDAAQETGDDVRADEPCVQPLEPVRPRRSGDYGGCVAEQRHDWLSGDGRERDSVGGTRAGVLGERPAFQ